MTDVKPYTLDELAKLREDYRVVFTNPDSAMAAFFATLDARDAEIADLKNVLEATRRQRDDLQKDAEIAAKDELIGKLIAAKPPEGALERKDAEIEKLKAAYADALGTAGTVLGVLQRVMVSLGKGYNDKLGTTTFDTQDVKDALSEITSVLMVKR